MKCWERFAEAAAGLGPSDLGVDLTVYVLGQRQQVRALSPAVRFVTLRPLLSSAPVVRSLSGADATDLAPYHPALARLLPRHDVWHLTHMFAFAATAARLARAQRRAALPERTGVVASVHTDVPALAAAYVRQLADRLPGMGGPLRRAAPQCSPDVLAAALVRRVRDRLLRVSDRVLVATASQQAETAQVVGAERVALLGRGIDRERFRPDLAARAELIRAHGIPADRPAVLFAGRVDASKRVMVLAEAVRRLRDEGRAVHLVVAGSGPDSGRVAALLGGDVTLLGPLPQDRLARVYAGCDVFAFPSLTETVGNVVAEAMACHLPVVLPADARTTGWLASPGQDGLVVAHDNPAGWAAALAGLVERPAWRTAMGARGGATVDRLHRSWTQVLAEDLLPVWHQVAPRPPGTADAPFPAAGMR
jgi:glycosyltransferase involved in cell wall biosynthesis